MTKILSDASYKKRFDIKLDNTALDSAHYTDRNGDEVSIAPLKDLSTIPYERDKWGKESGAMYLREDTLRKNTDLGNSGNLYWSALDGDVSADAGKYSFHFNVNFYSNYENSVVEGEELYSELMEVRGRTTAGVEASLLKVSRTVSKDNGVLSDSLLLDLASISFELEMGGLLRYDTWHSLSIVVNDNLVSVYNNGVLISSGVAVGDDLSLTTNNVDEDSRFYILSGGGYSGIAGYNFLISDFFAWDTALTAVDIKNIHFSNQTLNEGERTLSVLDAKRNLNKILANVCKVLISSSSYTVPSTFEELSALIDPSTGVFDYMGISNAEVGNLTIEPLTADTGQGRYSLGNELSGMFSVLQHDSNIINSLDEIQESAYKDLLIVPTNLNEIGMFIIIKGVKITVGYNADFSGGASAGFSLNFYKKANKLKNLIEIGGLV